MNTTILINIGLAVPVLTAIVGLVLWSVLTQGRDRDRITVAYHARRHFPAHAWNPQRSLLPENA